MKSSGKLKIHDNNYFQLDNDPKLTADVNRLQRTTHAD